MMHGKIMKIFDYSVNLKIKSFLCRPWPGVGFQTASGKYL